MNRLSILAATAVLVAACSAVGPSQPTPPSPSRPPSAPPSAQGFSLRTALRQSIPPAAAFNQLRPPVAIENGVLLIHAPLDTMFPMGLSTAFQQHTISEAGIQMIVDAATEAGLLTGVTDFAPDSPPGSSVAEVVLVIDGVEYGITGDPDRRIVCVTTPCEAAHGTPEAFGGFWAKLEDPQAFLGDELGMAGISEPKRLAILLTEPTLDATLEPEYADWPVEGVSMRDFGVELAAPGLPPARCGVIESEVSVVTSALRAGNESTRWRDASGAEYGIVSRPLFPGEASPCEPS
jgi:hypothetical protein